MRERVKKLEKLVQLTQDKAGLERLAEGQDIKNDVLEVFQHLRNSLIDAARNNTELSNQQREDLANGFADLRGLDIKHLMSRAQKLQAEPFTSLDDVDLGTFNADLFQDLIDLFAEVVDLDQVDIDTLEVLKTFLQFADLSGSFDRVASLYERRMLDAGIAFRASDIYNAKMQIIAANYIVDGASLDLDMVSTSVFETTVLPYLVSHPGLIDDPLTADALSMVFGIDSAAGLVRENFDGAKVFGRNIGPTIAQAVRPQMIQFIHTVHRMPDNKASANYGLGVFNTSPARVILQQVAAPFVEAFAEGISGKDPVLLTIAEEGVSFIPPELATPRATQTTTRKREAPGEFNPKRSSGTTAFDKRPRGLNTSDGTTTLDKTQPGQGNAKRRRGFDTPDSPAVFAAQIGVDVRDFRKPEEMYALMIRSATDRFGAIMDRVFEIFQVPVPKGFSSVEGLREVTAIASDILQLETIFGDSELLGFGFGSLNKLSAVLSAPSALGQLFTGAKDSVTTALKRVFGRDTAVRNLVDKISNGLKTTGSYATTNFGLFAIGLSLEMYTQAPFASFGIPAFKAAMSFKDALLANTNGNRAGAFTTGIVSLSRAAAAWSASNPAGAFAKMLLDNGVSWLPGLISHTSQLMTASMITVKSFAEIMNLLIFQSGTTPPSATRVLFNAFNAAFAILSIQKASILPQHAVRSIFGFAKVSPLVDTAPEVGSTTEIESWIKVGLRNLGNRFVDTLREVAVTGVENVINRAAKSSYQEMADNLVSIAGKVNLEVPVGRLVNDFIPALAIGAATPKGQQAWRAFASAYSTIYSDAAGARARRLFQNDSSGLRPFFAATGIGMATLLAGHSISSWRTVLKDSDISTDDFEAYVRSAGSDLTKIGTGPQAKEEFLQSVFDPMLPASFGLDASEAPNAAINAFAQSGLRERIYESLTALMSFDFQTEAGLVAAGSVALMTNDLISQILDQPETPPAPLPVVPVPQDEGVVDIVTVLHAASAANRALRSHPATTVDAVVTNLINVNLGHPDVRSAQSTRRATLRARSAPPAVMTGQRIGSAAMPESYTQIMTRIAKDEIRVERGLSEFDARKTLNMLWVASTFSTHLAAVDMLMGFPAEPCVAAVQPVADEHYLRLEDTQQIDPHVERRRAITTRAVELTRDIRLETMDTFGEHEIEGQHGILAPYVVSGSGSFMVDRYTGETSDLGAVVELDLVLSELLAALGTGEGPSSR